MKNKPLIITLIVLLSVLAISLIGFMIRVMSGSLRFNFNHKISTELIVDKIYDQTIDKLSIVAKQGDISIKTSSSNEVRLVIYGEEKLTNYNLTGGTLTVSMDSKPCIGFCFNTTVPKIEVYLPEDFTGNIDIDNKYGDIKVAEFKSATIDIEADCGDVSVEEGNIVKINNHYGDITLKNASEGTITNDCGDIKIGNIATAKIENHYGNVSVDRITSYTNIKADCGDVRIDELYLTIDSKIENNLGDIEIGKTNEIYISAKTSLGDTNIRNNYRESNIELKIENSCGNIDVKN